MLKLSLKAEVRMMVGRMRYGVYLKTNQIIFNLKFSFTIQTQSYDKKMQKSHLAASTDPCMNTASNPTEKQIHFFSISYLFSLVKQYFSVVVSDLTTRCRVVPLFGNQGPFAPSLLCNTCVRSSPNFSCGFYYQKRNMVQNILYFHE